MKILSLFLENPKEEYYGSEVSDKTGISVGAVNEHLKKLSAAGFLKVESKGRMTFYTLNKEDATVKHIKTARNLSKPLIEKLKGLGKKLDLEIYIYGSVARGEDKKDSDWDLLVIGDIDSAELQGEVDKLDEDIQINTSLFTRSEWNRMEKEDPAFYERVERDKIRLV